MITILHNARCRKSREALKILQESGIEYKIREYLKDPLSYEELKELQNKLGLKVIHFIRVKEKEFRELNLRKESSDEELLRAIEKYPKLLERAIVIKGKKAVLCRPPEKVMDIF